MCGENQELLNLCQRVRSHLERGSYQEGNEEICYAMYLHPDAPEPHNLMGILLEKKQDHVGAMKHFRAALDLDPTYLPAKENMMDYARFDLDRPRCRYCFLDCTGR